MAADALVSRTELTPVTFLRRSADMFPQKPAVLHGERRLTYRELEERVNRLASALRAAGLRKGDRVAFLAPNIPAMLEAHFGVPAAGGVLVAINIRLNASEIRTILQHSGARFLFVDRELAHLAPAGESSLTIVTIADTGRGDDPYEQFLSSGTAERPESWLENEEETISINYTSGTTGQPKGVMYSHRGAYLNALGEVIEMQLSYDSRYLWTVPMFHCNGWCFTWGVTAVAGLHICLRRVDPAEVWRLLADAGVTHFGGAPTVHISLINAPAARRLERPVIVAAAGAPPSPTLLARMKELNFRPTHLYGLTETYGPHTLCAWDPSFEALDAEGQARLRAQQGQAYTTADLVRVVDIGMKDVPRDGATMGEVVMRGNNVMKGYFNDPEATERAFTGGWFHSGDIAVWHENGYVELRDRGKDIIISGGENISTIEVEQTIAKHPSVLECAVIAIPDTKWGERPKAFVTLKANCSASEAEIIAFCRQQLAGFKVPAAVEFTALPKTSTGKVQKFVLREREWKGYEKRIN